MSHDEARRVFQAVDTFEVDAFVRLLAEDVSMVFGNAAPMVGHEGVTEGLRAFYATIGGLTHRIVRTWRNDSGTAAETEVTYRRLDGSDVSIAAVSIWRTRDDGLISDYRVFIDLAPLYSA
ncbi:nuclear transport factor 2 family protein [Nonomuraea sp. NPDC050790]|uniref:nuclear transport factor 2 family protein n=1 Tax=Nonomuraea sp. NPDC050790 TaxID=3364371 RepID=UPI00379C5D1E